MLRKSVGPPEPITEVANTRSFVEIPLDLCVARRSAALSIICSAAKPNRIRPGDSAGPPFAAGASNPIGAASRPG